ncbi:MAG TPA: xanthine dehydrogenase accessory protein XdhC [Hydrogenophaga sp.]|uniref:xanthine dehydrogenase accessory protein XdhC n=1 Tax=Hydrogenophaga sp. TaxID=1904254 RepID=UPI002B730ED7|nr:xanthine dehydrogenase accessory protein XdhC [Hydrogenophaga sp.]HMN93886.1 xanthine dehydrogenase accessory protein XdhC [Hydrogenophaga sp.]HMP11668.1 xanthine dehydrogenase accessory protein XdhC [Hydrogenophaga sp.]
MAFLQRLHSQPAVLVRVEAVSGSAPREAGAWMAVFAEGQIGTVGGGQLEWDCLRQARLHLARFPGEPHPPAWRRRMALGPSLGQCCGGAMELAFEPVDHGDIERLRQDLRPARRALALFGGGHVGQAIVRALRDLPFALTWIDSRDEIFPPELQPGIQCEHSDPVHRAVDSLPADSLVLIMSFSHAEDLDIVACCLQRRRASQDLPFVGLIGSRTKWTVFRRRLRERGFSDAELDGITCPIGLPGIRGKEPAVIAASVAAQLLMTC